MQILNVGQVCDLEHGGFTNQMSVRLRDGRVVIITTDEDTVAQLLNAAAAEMRNIPTSPATTEVSELPPDVPAGDVFGGDLPDPGEALDPPVPPATGSLDVRPEPEYPRDKLGKPIMRDVDGRGALGKGHPNKKGRVGLYRTVPSVPTRTVPMDEAGNPIVPAEHRVENQVAAELPDEDGESI